MVMGGQRGAEERIGAIERELMERVRLHAGAAPRHERWLRQLAERLAADEALRVEALRFIDVLPTLESDAAVAEHLIDHFAHLATPLPAAIRWALRHAETEPLPHLLAPIVRRSVGWIGTRFIAGETANEALAAIGRLREQGCGSSLDLLGEEVLSDIEADGYRDRYLKLIDDLAGPLGEMGMPLSLSLKVSSLDARLNPMAPEASAARIIGRLRPILAAVQAEGGRLTLDMEHFDTREITLLVLKGLLAEGQFRDFTGLGIAMQAYLRDSEAVLAALIDWAGEHGVRLHLRLVRGAYWEREIAVAEQHGWPLPVWRSKAECDACYDRCLALLIGNDVGVRPAIATHNPHSLATALALIERHGMAPAAYEFQMLYGMAEPLQAALVEMGLPLTIYTPVGEIVPGMAYLVRRLLENSSNSSLIRHALLAGQVEVGREAEAAYRSRPPAFANEPVYRFCGRQERQSMAQAIEAMRAGIGGHAPILIGGEAIDSSESISSVNPARPDELIGMVSAATPELVERAVQAASLAQPGWTATPVAERAAILQRAAALLAERRAEFAALEVLEAGKPWGEADADVCEAIDFLRYYGDQAEQLLRPVLVNLAGEENRYDYRALGVVAVIPPWNFPLAIPTGMTVAALASGNAVILKPSSETPMIAARLVDLLHQAGVPPAVLNYLPGSGGTAGESLVRHAGVHMVAFTGSLDVGLGIHERSAALAGEQGKIKRLIAEMGGKNAIIVDDDADPDAAIAGIIASAFGYAGQKCSACSRVIIVGSAYREFSERLAQAADSLPIGLPESPDTLLGPVISAAAQKRIQGVIERGRERARPLLVKQVEAAEGGYYVGPALFADVAPDDPLAQEEIFGPVLSVMAARSFDEAIRIANTSRYALTGGLYSRNPRHLQRAGREFEAGNLYLNRGITGAIVGRQPFGGFKLSGMGHKAGGPDYLLQFVTARSISENSMRRGFAPMSDDGSMQGSDDDYRF